MKRREFIALLGGAAVTGPFAARAQQPGRVRRIGFLSGLDGNDHESKVWFSGFMRGLEELGWTDGRNVRLEVRWAAGNVDRTRVFAKELVDLQPDVILAANSPVTAAFQRETRTIPIVFTVVSDPVGAGFVASFAHPGGNLTGFVYGEEGMASKWLELLREIAPSVKQVANMFSPDAAPRGGSFYLSSFEAAARVFKLATIIAPVHSDAEIETVINSLGRTPGGGLIVQPDAFTHVHRASIISLAARNNVPAVFTCGALCARDGGLLSYAPDTGDLYFRAASYVDRILRGAKPADLPIQVPIKFELAINLKTAKALGLTVPPLLIARADEVIE